MSYPLSWNYKYGSGTTDLTVSGNQIINKYVRVVAVSGKNITIDTSTITTDGYGDFFTVNKYVLFHVAAYKGSGTLRPARGHWRNAFITGVAASTNNRSVVTLSKSMTSALSGTPIAENLGDDGLYVQLVTIPEFKNITLGSGTTITCPQFTSSTGTGGIVAFMCADTLKFSGGHIDLAGKGIPAADASTFWQAGKICDNEPIDNTLLRNEAGWENYRAYFHLPVNSPDGALWAAAKKMTCHANSRIGNPNSAGKARNRGHYSSGTSGAMAGGSSIMIVAGEITNWNPAIISKYCSGQNGRGRCRCYIATETNLPTDEALYAFDRINDTKRLLNRCNVRLVEVAQDGDFKAGQNSWLTKQMNSYASVRGIAANRKTFTIDRMLKGAIDFKVGRLVMVHVTYNNAKASYSYTLENNGRFWLARITAMSTSSSGVTKITIDKPAFVIGSGEEEVVDFDRWATTDDGVRYLTQLITVPEFETFAMRESHNYSNGAHKFEMYTEGGHKYGYGGIFAIAVKGTCDLTTKSGYAYGGLINVEGKGGAPAYGEAGLDYIGNAQMSDRLPIGAGHGSVFILAGELKLDTNSRIGATYSGAPYGGINYDLSGANARNTTYQAFTGRHVLTTATSTKSFTDDLERSGSYGSASEAGTTYSTNSAVVPCSGGYGSNSSSYTDPTLEQKGGRQGAHVFIVANKITGMNMAAVSTGGEANQQYGSAINTAAEIAKIKKSSPIPTENSLSGYGCGGAGYGGAGGSLDDTGCRGGNGGFIGGGGGSRVNATLWVGGGGSSGFCFIYCNEVENQSADSGITLNT